MKRKDTSGGNIQPAYPLRASTEERAAWQKKAGAWTLADWIRWALNRAPAAPKPNEKAEK